MNTSTITVPVRRAGSALIIAATLFLMAAVVAFAASDGVCTGLSSGKIDVVGSVKTVTITAPEGSLITGYCVKAGSDNKDGGPVYVTLEEPVASLTISHPTGKDISHYSFSWAPTSTPSTTTTGSTSSPPTTASTTTSPTVTTTTTSPPSTTSTTTSSPPVTTSSTTSSTSSTSSTTSAPSTSTTSTSSTGPTTTSRTQPPASSPSSPRSEDSPSSSPASPRRSGPPLLAYTGPVGNALGLVALACVLTVLGVWFWRRSRDVRDTPRHRR